VERSCPGIGRCATVYIGGWVSGCGILAGRSSRMASLTGAAPEAERGGRYLRRSDNPVTSLIDMSLAVPARNSGRPGRRFGLEPGRQFVIGVRPGPLCQALTWF